MVWYAVSSFELRFRTPDLMCRTLRGMFRKFGQIVYNLLYRPHVHRYSFRRNIIWVDLSLLNLNFESYIRVHANWKCTLSKCGRFEFVELEFWILFTFSLQLTMYYRYVWKFWVRWTWILNIIYPCLVNNLQQHDTICNNTRGWYWTQVGHR